jgi:hypothetical protein
MFIQIRPSIGVPGHLVPSIRVCLVTVCRPGRHGLRKCSHADYRLSMLSTVRAPSITAPADSSVITITSGLISSHTALATVPLRYGSGSGQVIRSLGQVQYLGGTQFYIRRGGQVQPLDVMALLEP